MGKFYHALLKVIDWKTAKNLHFFIFHWIIYNFRSQLFSELGHIKDVINANDIQELGQAYVPYILTSVRLWNFKDGGS